MTGGLGRGQVPAGVRDLLFEEAAARRRLESALLDVYADQGYQEVSTPTLELLDTVVSGAVGQAQDELYKLVDRRGRLLVLRPDMTTPIARLVGTHLQGEPLPLRLCYTAPVFRHQPGRPHEVRQSGVELIGDGTLEADAEVIALLASALRTAGLGALTISLSHSGLLDGLWDQCGVPSEERAALRQSLLGRDLVAYEVAVRSLGLPAGDEELLLLASSLTADGEVLSSLSNRLRDGGARKALAEINGALARLRRLGVTVPVQVDLGLVRDQEYYTGLVFEAYTPGLGRPVAGGGRYDRLLRSFGRDLPATGFAVDMDLVLAAVMRQRGDSPGAMPQALRQRAFRDLFGALQGGIH